MEGDAVVVVTPDTQTPIMVRVALDRLPQPTGYPLGVGLGALEMEVMDRVTKSLVQGGWGHMSRECPTPSSALNQPWGTE